MCTVLNLKSSRKLSMGCPILDDAMRGGIIGSGITEIVGEAGTGKTQICLQLLLQCVVGQSNCAAAFMSCGEGEFPLKRLSQLCERFEKVEDVLNKILVETCHTFEDALETLQNVLPTLCQSRNIKLLVIDSLAGIVRTEFDVRTAQDISSRTSLLFQFATKLKWLGDTFGLTIVVVNQVTANFEEPNANNSTIPALGLAWSHCVNTRILLTRDSSGIRSISQPTISPPRESENVGCTPPLPALASTRNMSSDELEVTASPVSLTAAARTPAAARESTVTTTTSHRVLSLLFSPCQPRLACEYVITPQGVLGTAVLYVEGT